MVIRVLALQAHNTQLLNLLKKEHAAHNAAVEALAESSNGSSSSTTVPSHNEAEPTQRKFHFKTSHKRHILLKFYYLGWDYQGFTSQEHTTQTIEHHLFKALTKTCLIETRETSNYHRCGRTDKGVSAFSQVISIDVRSKFSPELQMNEESLKNEMNYCEALNRVLPANIKCLSWAPCEKAAYSARLEKPVFHILFLFYNILLFRFDCKKRSYRYFFPRGNMNIEAMRSACKHLVGINDFRNLCKMDVQNGVVEFIREIKGADIHLASESLEDPGYDMFYMELIGKAYLWHQVRCIMAILLLVGQEQEHPDVMAELMDVAKNPWYERLFLCDVTSRSERILTVGILRSTPQYSMASDLALNLWNVEYKDESDTDENGVQFKSVQWQYDELNLRRLIIVLQSQWTTSSVQYDLI